MAGGGGLVVPHHRNSRHRSRWVGRASILASQPDAPQWLKYLVLTISMFGMQLVWSCEMAQGTIPSLPSDSDPVPHSRIPCARLPASHSLNSLGLAASPYLLSLGLSKSMMSIVFVAGPLSGLIVQPVVGIWSDGCKSSLGRRRPFIIGGCIISSLGVMLLGWSKEVAGWFTTADSSVVSSSHFQMLSSQAKYSRDHGRAQHKNLTIGFAILSVYIIDFNINVVQAMDRALLVDVIPPSLQPTANAWASRLFGFGAVFGYWVGGLDLVTLTGGYMGKDQLKVLTGFTAFWLCGCHAVTVGCVTERVLISRDDDEDGERKGWEGMKRSLGEIWTTLKTLPRPIQQVFNVQFSNWVGWFPVLFFSTTWVAEIYVSSHSPLGSDLAAAPPLIRENATRAGTRAMFYHSLVALLTSILVPALVSPSNSSSAGSTESPFLNMRSPRSTSHSNSPFPSIISTTFTKLFESLPTIPFSWLSLGLLWTISNGVFAMLLFGTYLASTVGGASFVIAAMGFCWAVSNWAPYAILGDLILRTGGPGSPLMMNQMGGDWNPAPLSPIAEEDESFISNNGTPKISHHHHHQLGDSSYEEEDTEEDVVLKRFSTPPPDRSKSPFDPTASPPRPSDAYQEANPDTPSRSHSHSRRKSDSSSSSLDWDSPDHSKRFSRPPLYPPNHQSSVFDANVNMASLTDLYGSPIMSHLSLGETTPTVLQIRHSDSFEMDRESIHLSKSTSGVGGGEGLGFGDVIGAGASGREIPSITLGESGDEWEPDLEGDEGDGGGDQAGVILGCHNIYVVIPQFLVTALSSIIFAIFAPYHSVVAGHGGLPPSTSTTNSTLTLLERAVKEVVTRADGLNEGGDWDALGMIFRIAGVSVVVSTFVCWRMTRERDRDRDRLRRSRGNG